MAALPLTRRPDGLLLCGLLAFSPALEGGTTHTALLIIRLMILALFGLWWTEQGRTGECRLLHKQLAWPISAFVAVAAISTAGSSYLNQSVQWLTILIGYTMLLVVSIGVLRSWEDIRQIIRFTQMVSIVEVGWALWQWVDGSVVRPTASFFNPNFLAGYLIAVSCLVLGPLLYNKRPVSQRNFQATLLQIAWPGLVCVVIWCVVILTGSRSTALTALTGIGFVLFMRFGLKAVSIILLVLAICVTTPTALRDRLLAEHHVNPMAYSRIQLWEKALAMMTDHPLGVGLGLYQYRYPQYAIPVDGQITRYDMTAQTPHNEYLQIGVELGLFGLSFFMLGILSFARIARNLLYRRLRRSQRGQIVGCLGGIASVLTHAMIDSNLREPGIAVLLTVLVALVLRAVILSTPKDAARTEHSCAIHHRWIWNIVGGLILVGSSVHVGAIGLAYLHYDKASQLQAHGQSEAAVALLRESITLDAGKSMYHRALAGAFHQEFQRSRLPELRERALTEIRTAMELNPLDARLPVFLARLYTMGPVDHLALPTGPAISAVPLDHAGLRLAVTAYEKAVTLEPYKYSHRLELAQVYSVLGNWAQAEEHVRRAIDLEPNCLRARAWLVEHHMQFHRHDKADLEFNEIVERLQRLTALPVASHEQFCLNVDIAKLARILGRDGVSQ